MDTSGGASGSATGDIFEIRSTDKADLDITDADGVLALMRNFKTGRQVYAAALLVTDFCEKNPEVCLAGERPGALNVAEGCRARPKMAFISTEQVFNGNMGPGPYSEDDIPQPNTVYGRNKLEAETGLARDGARTLDPALCVDIRISRKESAAFAELFWEVVRAALRGKKLKDPVNELRSLTYIYDIIDQFDKVFTLPFGLYHVGSPNEMNRYEVAREILTLIGAGHRLDELLQRIVKSIRTSRGTSGSIRQKSHATASRSPKRGMDFADSFRSSDSYPESAGKAAREPGYLRKRLDLFPSVRITSSGLIFQYSGRKAQVRPDHHIRCPAASRYASRRDDPVPGLRVGWLAPKGPGAHLRCPRCERHGSFPRGFRAKRSMSFQASKT